MTVQPTTPIAAPSLLLTPRQAAKALSISERTLWAITAPRGSLSVVKVGPKRRAVRYSVADLEAWVAAQRQTGEVP